MIQNLGRLRSASTALLCLLAISGCAQAPIALKYKARSALDGARQAGAVELAQGPLEAAERAFAAAGREMAAQMGSFSWNRSFTRSEALLEAALRRARLAETLARAEKRRAQEEADRLLLQARAAFAQMERLQAYIPPRSFIRSDVRRAQVSQGEAQNLLLKGDFAAAAAAARRANEGIAAARLRFARYVEGAADPARQGLYARWVSQTVSLSSKRQDAAIIVDKMRRTLTLLSGGRRLRSYPVELGINGTLDKVVSGDRATPEGMYRVTEKRGPRQTRWYKALLLNYPNDDDLKRFDRAKRQGLISRRARIGGLIEIHGEGGRGGDWTDGCVALTNREMDDLFGRVSVGTPVTIVGYDADASPAVARTAGSGGPPGRRRAAGRSGSGSRAGGL